MRASPEQRTAAFYFTLFLSGGVANSYLAIWLHDRGLTEQQIGIINAAPILVMVLFNILVGRIADRAPDWRGVIVLGAWATGLFPIGLYASDAFWPILAFWTLHAVAHLATVTVTDAATLRMTARSGRDFGSLRAWGTAGYLVTLMLTGLAADQWGSSVFLPLILITGLARALAALALPRFRAPDGAAPQAGARQLRSVMRPWFLLPLIGYAFVNASHWVQGSFQSLIWAEQGISPTLIGILIAIGALSETAMFFVFGRIARGYRARTLLLVSAAVTVLRWLAMATAPGIGWLVALQATHGVSYCLGFMAAMQFIANWTAEDIAAEAQGFFVTLNQATAVGAIAAFGWVLGAWGDLAFLALAVLALFGLVLIVLSRRVAPPA